MGRHGRVSSGGRRERRRQAADRRRQARRTRLVRAYREESWPRWAAGTILLGLLAGVASVAVSWLVELFTPYDGWWFAPVFPACLVGAACIDRLRGRRYVRQGES